MSEERDFDAAALIGLALMANPNGTLERLGGGGEFNVESFEPGNAVLRDEAGERYHVEAKELILPTFYPVQTPTTYATTATITSGDGSFTVSFQELRQIEPSVSDAPYDPTKHAFVEVSRVHLSPLALRILQRRIDMAVENYESLYGELPGFDELMKRLGSKAAVERLLQAIQRQRDDQ